MCTLSWLLRPRGYSLFMNRDERTTRLPAQSPREDVLRGVRFVSPRDADAGGTWILVNERGVALALLNRYAPMPAGRTFTSRGLLVLGLADAAGREDVRARLEREPLGAYQPFTLAAVDRGGPPLLFTWDGTRLDERDLGDDDRPLTSSGYDAGGVARMRRAELARLAAANGGVVDARVLDALHRSHHPERGPFSACMHRDEAGTVSYTRIEVEESAIRLIYHPGPPCEPRTDIAIILQC